MSRRGRIWIQGAGELASAVAWRLVRCGYQVMAAEIACPLAVRRRVVYCEAVYSTVTEIEGIRGRLRAAETGEFRDGEVVVIVDPTGQQLDRVNPAAVVDARMTKRSPRPLPHGERPLIGLGPGFRCGRDADLVVETHRLARLGTLITRGEAMPNTGLPGPVGGEAARRVLRSPAAGRLEPTCAIGDLVNRGETVGHVAGVPVVAHLDGLMRGLIHPQAELSRDTKVGDIDPRGDQIDPNLISDKGLAVAGGVLEGLLRLGVLPPETPCEQTGEAHS